MIERMTVFQLPFRVPLTGISDILARLHDRIARWRDNRRGRRILAAMDSRAIKDLGLSRVDVWREVNKPFWES